MNKIILFFTLILSIGYCSTQNTKTKTNPSKETSTKNTEIKKLTHYLENHWETPEQYILNKFKKYDIIFLSENHAIKHNLILCQNIIPQLYKAGVYNFGMEFGASEDQKRLDSLVTAPEYNEDIARRIMFNYNVGWAFKEYMDIYKAAWKLNNSLPPQATKFRIINLSYKYKWTACDAKNFGIKTPETVRRIFYKGGTEEHRAQQVKKEIIDKKEKILILTGGLHAFTKYHQPEYDYYAKDFYRLNNRSLGNLVYKMVPDKVFTILLHFPFESKTKANLLLPAKGKIDEALSYFENKRVAFDLKNTPFGELKDTSYFSIGYPNFCLGEMADGYIYEKPFDEYEGCTLDERFFTIQNWDDISKQYPDQDRFMKPQNLDEYISNIKKYLDMKERYKKLKY